MTARERQIRKQVRKLIRHERRLAKQARAELLSFARVVSANPTTAKLRLASRQTSNSFERILIRRLRLISYLFGGDTLKVVDRNKSMLPGFEIKDATTSFESAVSRWLRQHAAKRASSITETFRKWIAGVIADGNDAGLGEKEIGREIRRRAPKMARSSAERIARTETHTGSQRGSWEAAKASAVELVKEWASSEDRRVRETHAEADGQVINDLDEPFLVGDSDMLYPGDETAEAKEIVNCRCIALYHPVIGGVILR